MSGKGNDIDRIDALKIDALKKQYDKLTEDWRYFNNLIWGVPTIAIAVMTGIMIGAYHNLHDGTWERIASLSIGSFFLLALTIEVVKKRYHMNVISSLLRDLQIELGLEKFEFPLGISGDIDKYLDKKRRDGVQFADYKYDPLFKFFAISYARKFLTYVIFSGAIILAILAEWEFVRYQMIGRWTIVAGVTVGIITVTIPVVWYIKEWYKKRKKTPLLSIKGVEKSLNQGDERTLEITTTNRRSNEPISEALIKCGIFLSDEKKVQFEEGSTDCNGKRSYKLKTDKSWDPGKYSVKVGVFVNSYKDEYNTKEFKVKTSKIVDNK
jgi:hypothetical protein